MNIDIILLVRDIISIAIVLSISIKLILAVYKSRQ
jgi:hypothetical protein